MHAGRPKNAAVLLLILHTLIPRQSNMTKILLFMLFFNMMVFYPQDSNNYSQKFLRKNAFSYHRIGKK